MEHDSDSDGKDEDWLNELLSEEYLEDKKVKVLVDKHWNEVSLDTQMDMEVKYKGYVYAEDETLDGPDSQWEILKYARIDNYTPKDEWRMTANQRAQAAVKRERAIDEKAKASEATSDSSLKSCEAKRPGSLINEMSAVVMKSIAGLTFAEKADLSRQKCIAAMAARQQGAGEGFHKTSLEQPISRLEDPRMSINGVEQQWQLLSVAVDSGAAETVIPYSLIKGYPVKETEASKSGLNYASATGEPIPNLGEQVLPLMMEEGTVRGMTFQAAPVARPLGSVMRICKAGHRVVFDDDGSYIENKTTGEINWMRQENGNYMLDMWVIPEASFGRQP